MMTTFLAALAMALATSAGDAPSAPRDTPSAASLRAWHELLGSEPHVAGTPGDARQIERLRGAFVGLGLEVEVHEIFPLLCRPVAASLEVVESIDASDAIAEASPAGSATADAAHATPGPNAHPEARARRGVVGLDLRERNLLEDPATAHPDLTYGWNAYSGSGDVTAEPVYVNYATREDFERLRELGVDVAGKIAIARYGRNFRGDKVRFAERAGAVGLVIFSDPADVARGPAYPEGGWANDSCIQRGSVMRLGQPGDPLTPGVPATADAARLAPDAAGLPRIPVQPIGYAAAGSILGRMRGDEAPEAWRGGLTLPYRLTGGPGVRLHLRVEQAREIMRTANVVGTLRGTTDEFVVVGCHHDAWGFGAADPLAGTIVLMETARGVRARRRDRLGACNARSSSPRGPPRSSGSSGRPNGASSMPTRSPRRAWRT
ncbi:MAG: PA domain-containing protein [Phycisphaerales bacterium]